MNFILGIHGLHSFYIIHHVIEALLENNQSSAILSAVVLSALLVYLVWHHFK